MPYLHKLHLQSFLTTGNIEAIHAIFFLDKRAAEPPSGHLGRVLGRTRSMRHRDTAQDATTTGAARNDIHTSDTASDVYHFWPHQYLVHTCGR